MIAHTSDDILTILTGVYPKRHGVANAANSYQFYKSTGSTGFQSAFTYWTDTIGDGAYNLISGPIDSTHPNGVNAPAPWVPFTRAGYRSQRFCRLRGHSYSLCSWQHTLLNRERRIP